MICMTGDVHHEMGTLGQSFLETSEARVAKEYVDIAQQYDIKTTLFVTGKAFKENGKTLREVANRNCVEIGGHTWNALRPKFLHNLFKIIIGSKYGPKVYQKFDIKRTLNIIKEKTGERPISWRTHSYASNKATIRVLKQEEVKVISDEVNNEKICPERVNERILSLPINVMPDHEHVYYGARTKEHVENAIKNGWSDSFTSASFTIGQYKQIIMRQIREIERKGGIATVLLHPFTMKIADDFATFKEICEWIKEKKYRTIFCKEVLRIQ